MRNDINTKDDFIIEIEKFIVNFELHPSSQMDIYQNDFSCLKHYFYNHIRNNDYIYLSFDYVYILLENIEYAYFNLDQNRDLFHSSLPHNLSVLIKSQHSILYWDEDDEEEWDDDDDDEE